ncbi:MAG: PDZ domain-containing protein [Chloroflexota bacterium]
MGVPVTVIDGQVVIGFDRARLEAVLSQRRETPRPSLGAAVADASKITARQGAGITLGAYVGGIRPGSAAARLGLQPGDIIAEVNHQNIANAADLERALAGLGQGSHLMVVFLRGDKRLAAEGVA